jgi:hypothetical protein
VEGILKKNKLGSHLFMKKNNKRKILLNFQASMMKKVERLEKKYLNLWLKKQKKKKVI